MQKGLGDIIEGVAKVTGIKKMVDSKAEDAECTPCAKRKAKANKAMNVNIPYKFYV